MSWGKQQLVDLFFFFFLEATETQTMLSLKNSTNLGEIESDSFLDLVQLQTFLHSIQLSKW